MSAFALMRQFDGSVRTGIAFVNRTGLRESVMVAKASHNVSR